VNPCSLTWWVLGVASPVVMILGIVVMAPSAKVLKATGIGIVPFETAWAPQRCREILRTWGPTGRKAAWANICGDFPFLVGYSLLLFVACWTAAPTLGGLTWPLVGQLGGLIGVGALVAGACDAIEDICLLVVLAAAGKKADLTVPGPLVRLAAIAAWVKFGLLGVAVSWLLLFEVPALVTALG
jgi:hypothetical protein